MTIHFSCSSPSRCAWISSGVELGDPAQVEHISELREWIRAAVAKLRNLMFELRPPILDEEGLAAAIDEYATYWNLEQSVTIHDGFSEEPPEEQRLLLYRIAQEAFANIRKHAKAASIDITLEQQDQIFLVRMVDDGVGFDPGRVVGAKDGHIGLSSMRERAEMAGGVCRIHSLPGEGTTVEFWCRPRCRTSMSARGASSLTDGDPVTLRTWETTTVSTEDPPPRSRRDRAVGAGIRLTDVVVALHTPSGHGSATSSRRVANQHHGGSRHDDDHAHPTTPVSRSRMMRRG